MNNVTTITARTKGFIQKIRYSEFIRNVITLMTGTGLAVAIPILAAPILTRLYTPADYGTMTLYSTVAGLVSVGATGMYAHAIILAKNENEASNAFGLSLFITLCLTLVTMLVVVLFNEPLTNLLGDEALSGWLYFVPLSVFLAGTVQSFNYWANRQRQYKRLATSRVVGGGSGTGTQLILGFLNFTSVGLILGLFVGNIANLLTLIGSAWHHERTSWRVVTKKGMKYQARTHQNLPKYLLPSEFINMLVNRLPVLFLATFATTSSIGLYGFALRILGLPMSLLSSSVSDVFRERASKDYAKYGNCREIYLKTMRSLALLAIGPFTVLFIVGPMLFAFVFGEEWRAAGEYTRWLSIMYFFGFVSSPLSYVYYIAGRQREDLLLHIYMGFSTFLVMYLSHLLFDETLYIIILFSINYSSIYILYIFRSYKFAKGKPDNIVT